MTKKERVKRGLLSELILKCVSRIILISFLVYYKKKKNEEEKKNIEHLVIFFPFCYVTYSFVISCISAGKFPLIFPRVEFFPGVTPTDYTSYVPFLLFLLLSLLLRIMHFHYKNFVYTERFKIYEHDI